MDSAWWRVRASQPLAVHFGFETVFLFLRAHLIVEGGSQKGRPRWCHFNNTPGHKVLRSCIQGRRGVTHLLREVILKFLPQEPSCVEGIGETPGHKKNRALLVEDFSGHFSALYVRLGNSHRCPSFPHESRGTQKKRLASLVKVVNFLATIPTP
jgi:hypothetical protein